MIYFEGLESIIECIYLGESINNRPQVCNIFVNPENIKYLMGKIVIINTTEYPKENIDTLVENGCKVISRVYFDNTGIEVQPYILKLNDHIAWNGRSIEKFSDLSELLENDYCTFDLNEYRLYFPKLQEVGAVMDDYGNLTSLGWVLQQVGVNIKTDTPFKDMDVIKSGKIVF